MGASSDLSDLEGRLLYIRDLGAPVELGEFQLLFFYSHFQASLNSRVFDILKLLHTVASVQYHLGCPTVSVYTVR